MTEMEKDALTVLMHRMAMPEAERKADLAEAAEGRLRVPLRVLEGVLSSEAALGHEYLCANRFTVADLCVASVGMWIRPSSGLMAEFPLTAAWLKRCLDRPAHQAARKLGR
jgi:glutathione S-transferase